MRDPVTFQSAYLRHGTRLGAWLLTGSVFTDAMLWGVSAAKVLGVLGIFLLFVTTLVAPRLTTRELVFLGLTWAVVLLNLAFYPTAYPENLSSIVFSFAQGTCLILVLVMTARLTFSCVLRYFAGWAVAASLLGIVQALTGTLFLSDRVFFSTVIPGTWRASGFCNDPNYFALLTLIALPIVWHQRRIAPHRWWTLGAAVLAASVVFSGSRAGILLLPVGPVLAGLMLKRRLASKAFYVAAVAAVCVPAVVATFDRLPESVRAVFDSRSYDEASERISLRVRARAARAAVTAAREHPLFGYGIGNIVNHPDNPAHVLSHNNYLEVLADTGAPGLAMYLWLIVHCLNRLLRMTRAPHGGTALLAKHVLTSFLAYLLMSASLVTYYSRMWFFLVGVVFVAMRISDRTARVAAAVPRSPSQTLPERSAQPPSWTRDRSRGLTTSATAGCVMRRRSQ